MERYGKLSTVFGLFRAFEIEAARGRHGYPRGNGKAAHDTRSRIYQDVNSTPARQGRSTGRKRRKSARK